MTKKVCGAKTRRGTPCQVAPMANGRCYRHGGATPGGAAAGSFKHGRYSKYISNPNLLELYHTAVGDPDLLNLSHEIALIDARLGTLLSQTQAEESVSIWRRLRDASENLKLAKAAKDAEAMAEQLNRIVDLIDTNTDSYTVWSEINDTIERRRRLVESESKRLRELEQNITVENAMLFARELIEAVKRHVKDEKALQGIQLDIARLTRGQRVG